jgi:hypothetical protein
MPVPEGDITTTEILEPEVEVEEEVKEEEDDDIRLVYLRIASD